MPLPSKWYRYLEVVLILVVLIGLGVARFSRITPEQQQEIALEAGLEQLYQLEQEHFRQSRSYFDPTDSLAGLEWQWIKGYEWDVRIQQNGFWIAARADLDGDGEKGVWFIDDKSPVVHRLAQD